MPEMVLSVGTEEMPARAVAPALEQLRAAVERGLRDARLGAERVEVYGTPRHLIVRAVGVPDRQPDQVREVRGPAKAVAFDAQGKPTGAALGFARKQGVPVEALEMVSTPQGEYVMARVTDVGKPAQEVLGDVLREAVMGLFFPKMMRWGEGQVRFVRPVRRLVALLDAEVIPMEIAGVQSGRTARGHRYLSADAFEIPHADALLARLHDAYVMADPEERRKSIREQADRLAREVGGSVPWDEELLEENVWLVEWPTALLGRFDPEYLSLPRPVLITAMKKHQRFFPVEDAQGRLLPYFISIRNGGTEHLDVVREGNERVLSARFADARYFYQNDRQIPLEQMAERLNRLIFQEKLGTLAEKRQRLEWLMGELVESCGLDGAARQKAIRAARLCKADLVSQMVIELPSLQGIMGREYALLHGEDPAVAEAIAEHYQPRSANDAIPSTLLGSLLAVADRIDTLVGYVGSGILPSGSSDPYGLRRAAQGVVQILAGAPQMPPLVELEVLAAQAYQAINNVHFSLDSLCNDLGGLFDQRIAAFLEDRGVRYDLVDAALSGGLLYSTLVYGVVRRAETLQNLANTPGFVLTTQAAARVANILKAAEEANSGPPLPGKEGIHGASGRSVERAVSVLESEMRHIDQRLLKEPAENRLFDTAYRLLPEIAHRATDYDFVGLYHALEPLREPVDQFFDDVMVMVEEAALRRNRLALLRLVDALYKTLADFTKVVIV